MRRGTVEKDRVRKPGSAAADDADGFGAGGAAGVSGTGSRMSKNRSSLKAPSGNEDPIGLSGKKVPRRASVDAVLDLFKAGKRDMTGAYLKIKELEGEDMEAVISALEQLSDILCHATYFKKAKELLQGALKDITGNPVLCELMARVAFVCESWSESIKYNQMAAELQKDKASHNFSDIGLAYYRMAIDPEMGQQKHIQSAFKFCKMSLE